MYNQNSNIIRQLKDIGMQEKYRIFFVYTLVYNDVIEVGKISNFRDFLSRRQTVYKNDQHNPEIPKKLFNKNFCPPGGSSEQFKVEKWPA